MTWEVYQKPYSVIYYSLGRNRKLAQYIFETKNNEDLREIP